MKYPSHTHCHFHCQSHCRFRSFASGAAGISAFCVATAAIAAAGAIPANVQAPPPTSRVRTFQTMPAPNGGGRIMMNSSGNGPNRSFADSLTPLLDQIYWDSSQQGALLIVSPESIRRLRAFQRALRNSLSVRPSAQVTPDADGKYRLQNLADPFDRRLVSVGGVTVFAPRMMEVLNWKDLPAPDPAGSLTDGQKIRLLESTLTAEQWHKIGSPAGLGAGDLTHEQRTLYLSLLPNPFVLHEDQSFTPGTPPEVIAAAPRSEPVTLSSTERANVRLRLKRMLTWSFTTPDGTGNIGTGNGLQNRQGRTSDNYVISYRPLFPRMFGESGPTDLFGARVKDEIPSRLKVGQLPFDWSALHVNVSLSHEDQPLTVGELIKRVAAVTHVELYCDPRYSDQAAYVRGASAQAGDLLQALCWGVSGIFRKVGPAYVLTDDVAGLGTRHAAIRDWAAVGNKLAKDMLAEETQRLDASHYSSFIAWEPNDPYRPSEAIAAKLDDLASRPEGIVKNIGPDGQRNITVQPPLTPVSELPESVRAVIAENVESYNKQLQNMPAPSNPNFTDFRKPITGDKVRLDVRLVPYFEVPGMGTFPAPSGFTMGTDLNLRAPGLKPDINSAIGIPQPKLPSLPRLSLDGLPPMRALIIEPGKPEEMEKIAREAKSRGFTQLWVNMPGEDTPERKATLEKAIKAGKAAGLAVYARMSALRHLPKAGETVPGADRNIGAETLTEYTTRESRELKKLLPSVPSPLSPQANDYSYSTGTSRILLSVDDLMALGKDGDWLALDDEATRQKVFDSLATLSKTSGLEGIVVGTAAPGYRNQVDGKKVLIANSVMQASIEQGYTDSMRLAFLRQTGIDPVDLSPLRRGSLDISYEIRPPFQRSELDITTFPDSGPNAENFTTNGVSGITMGAKDGWFRWNEFRSQAFDHFLLDAAHAIHAQSPNMKVVEEWNDGALIPGMKPGMFGIVDAKTEAAARANTGAARRADVPPPYDPGGGRRMSINRVERFGDYTALAFSRSDTALLLLDFDPAEMRRSSYYASVANIGDLFGYSLQPYCAGGAKGWNGIVINLSKLTFDQKIEAIHALQPASASPPRSSEGVE